MAPTRSGLGPLLPLISLLAATVTALPSPPCKRAPDNAVALGCYLDNAGGKRALEARSYASDDMTVDSCGAFCLAAKFPLFAVTYGRECFCGDAVSQGNTKVADGDCSFPCAGNPTQACGAGDRINLYSLPNVPVRGPASLPGITSLGCFVDTASRVFPFKATDANDMTAAKCAANCAGYPYFGTQWSRECYCGTTAPTVTAPASECSMACSGDDGELCGAGMRLNVYQFGSEATPTPTSAPTPTPSVPVVDGFEYQGCYTDNVPQRVLAGKIYVENAMTLAKCAASCKASQYGWFGVTYGTECYCGASLDGDSVKAPEVQCDMPCSGDSSEKCGSSSRLNVYKDPALAVPTAGNLETVGGFSYQSCWTDNTIDRSLKAVDYRTDDMTIEKCAERCAEYRYFGVEYSRECYCGNELGGQLAPAKECGMLCMGSNGNQWCGGPDRLNLYSKVATSSSVSAPASTLSTSSAESSTISEASTSEPPVVTTSSSSADSTTSSEPDSTTSSAAESTTSSEPESTTSSESEPTTSSAAESTTSTEVVSTTSSTSTFPSSTSFSSTTSSTSQGPSLTTITSCPPAPTVADVPELCYYPKLPTPCDRLTVSTFFRSMSAALRSCQVSLGAWGMTANPVATACFPTTTAANPTNSAAASTTMSSVWSCLQTAGVLCSTNADCVTKTYTVGQVPPPVPTVGVDVLGDGGFESGTYGGWTLTGFNQHLTSEIHTGRPHSGSYGLRLYFPNTNGISGTFTRQVLDIEPGKPYEFRYWYYQENSNALMSIYQYVYPVGASSSFDSAQIYQTPAGVWTQRIVSFTPTSSFLNLRISAGGNVKTPNGSNEGKNTVWIDDIQLVRMA